LNSLHTIQLFFLNLNFQIGEAGQGAIMPSNYQPRGTSQTRTTGSGWGKAHDPTSGDVALLAQNNKFELLSQNFVGSISVVKNGEDITVQSQNLLLAINIKLTSASATVYQPSASPEYWASGITDWFQTYTQQVAYASAQGWQ
jgi:hypothetical protein